MVEYCKENNDMNRIKVLMDIYKTENEQIKHEYRVLLDKYVLLENNNIELLQELERYKNSRSIKISKKIKESRLYRICRKIFKR